MCKWIGATLILAASGGLLGKWYLLQKERQYILLEFIRLFTEWEHCLLVERRRLCDFLENYYCKEERVSAFLLELKTAIEERRFPFGYEIWQKVLEDYRYKLGIHTKDWELLTQLSDAFFGLNQAEGLKFTRDGMIRLQDALEQGHRDFVQKKKVYMPVGMLGGVLLVILFL